jgi:hypothetical protein
MKKLVSIVLLAITGSVFAQEVQDLEVQYNPNSLNPIPLYEQLYKRRVWRQLDLREKQNKGFFAKNGELSKLIVDAVKSGELTDIYRSDSLTAKMSKAEFLESLVQEQAMQYEAWDPKMDYYMDDIRTYNGKNYRALRDTRGEAPGTDRATDAWAETSQGSGTEYLVMDMTKINLMEDMIFDRRRSRLYYDIQGVQILIPGDKTLTGLDVSLGWFKYKDLAKLFRNNIPKAVWFNPQNTAQNKNFADAFLLRLFHGVIYKVENADDDTINDTYSKNGRPYREGIWAREWEEIKLMEMEHNLWEF